MIDFRYFKHFISLRLNLPVSPYIAATLPSDEETCGRNNRSGWFKPRRADLRLSGLIPTPTGDLSSKVKGARRCYDNQRESCLFHVACSAFALGRIGSCVFFFF